MRTLKLTYDIVEPNSLSHEGECKRSFAARICVLYAERYVVRITCLRSNVSYEYLLSCMLVSNGTNQLESFYQEIFKRLSFILDPFCFVKCCFMFLKRSYFVLGTEYKNTKIQSILYFGILRKKRSDRKCF